ncbi:MAG TPA: tRNA glutamyl-Q(34) synthetase GluQRS [Deltaproteobacteria bacterium]|nr:tRNA glutamyl-Q(34) synthetase GluQRS [Deltaproteobacteria bacterium]HQB38574.1 tRNA glutamyl-Q(34) synthetase GluQRS [Deltaproteobacteria bacterium]
MTSPPHKITGRFAPSPTGLLHIGSLVAATGSWLMARSAGGRWLLRIDDLDTPRLKPETVDDILRTLEAFALTWDGEISWQSRNQDAYIAAFERLKDKEVIFPCGCSRKEIALSASAPHPDDDCLHYSGACRSGMKTGATMRSWRIRVPDREICFDDLRCGRICQNLARSCGDFVLRRTDDVFAYQLAVVVDDQITGVNQVVRGADLLSSTPRQIYIQQQLGLPQPKYCHLPLATGPDGAKLSKRDNLVSAQLGVIKGREGLILFRILEFLGQNPPAGLEQADCRELLAWGIKNFDAGLMPAQNSELHI